jgi:hypothetical protein
MFPKLNFDRPRCGRTLISFDQEKTQTHALMGFFSQRKKKPSITTNISMAASSTHQEMKQVGGTLDSRHIQM